jgi:uncharacterized protein YcaQ
MRAAKKNKREAGPVGAKKTTTEKQAAGSCWWRQKPRERKERERTINASNN